MILDLYKIFDTEDNTYKLPAGKKLKIIPVCDFYSTPEIETLPTNAVNDIRKVFEINIDGNIYYIKPKTTFIYPYKYKECIIKYNPLAYASPIASDNLGTIDAENFYYYGFLYIEINNLSNYSLNEESKIILVRNLTDVELTAEVPLDIELFKQDALNFNYLSGQIFFPVIENPSLNIKLISNNFVIYNTDIFSSVLSNHTDPNFYLKLKPTKIPLFNNQIKLSLVPESNTSFNYIYLNFCLHN